MIKSKYFEKINKSLEFQIARHKAEKYYLDFQIRWTRNCDHAGFEFYLELFGAFIELNFIDVRQWDWDKKCWCVYEGKE